MEDNKTQLLRHKSREQSGEMIMAARKNSKKLFFPDGALLNAMEIAVVESERRKTEILKEPYTVYLVETR